MEAEYIEFNTTNSMAKKDQPMSDSGTKTKQYQYLKNCQKSEYDRCVMERIEEQGSVFTMIGVSWRIEEQARRIVERGSSIIPQENDNGARNSWKCHKGSDGGRASHRGNDKTPSTQPSTCGHEAYTYSLVYPRNVADVPYKENLVNRSNDTDVANIEGNATDVAYIDSLVGRGNDTDAGNIDSLVDRSNDTDVANIESLVDRSNDTDEANIESLVDRSNDTDEAYIER
ncbi:unnamed protein product [Mytilus coruscus]|uniref:Uncharacterized protein n=1 Tax=Mytilus coruscus TaxID=42192 RepID=A0A6J8AYW5_MYTCO|nr:unnamed protein product [Mytilus coruscus]